MRSKLRARAHRDEFESAAQSSSAYESSESAFRSTGVDSAFEGNGATETTYESNASEVFIQAYGLPDGPYPFRAQLADQPVL